MGDYSNNHKGEHDDFTRGNDTNDEHKDKMGPTVGSPDSLQPTVDPNITPKIDLDSSNDEEIAEEMTANDIDNDAYDNHEDISDNGAIHSAVGWVAIELSAISFFMMPIILGAAGIIVGFVARSRDAKTLGTIAIVAGAVAILYSLFARPYV
ncbi:MAG TPA: hypothetical protein VK142_06400 [Bacillota bacterium]|nr:hypothetical protein [Bacillota bacterium]